MRDERTDVENGVLLENTNPIIVETQNFHYHHAQQATTGN
jgi:hypothetical protein